jgi:hypothetical protein
MIAGYCSAGSPRCPDSTWAETAGFPGDHADALRALAAVVLPSELGADGLDRVAAAFGRWVREYRAGAEMDLGYGFTRIRRKPASPAPAYLQQLAELRPAQPRRRCGIAPRGGTSGSRIGEGDGTAANAGIAACRRRLMAFYFRSSDANDLTEWMRTPVGPSESFGPQPAALLLAQVEEWWFAGDWMLTRIAGLGRCVFCLTSAN